MDSFWNHVVFLKTLSFNYSIFQFVQIWKNLYIPVKQIYCNVTYEQTVCSSHFVCTENCEFLVWWFSTHVEMGRYVEPSVRPDDSRYGDNPNRVQCHTQFQVLLFFSLPCSSFPSLLPRCLKNCGILNPLWCLSRSFWNQIQEIHRSSTWGAWQHLVSDFGFRVPQEILHESTRKKIEEFSGLLTQKGFVEI